MWVTLPDLIVNQIFGYLEFRDVLNASSVSRSWYIFFGEQNVAMSKMQLRIEGWQDLEIVNDILMKSPRHYSRIRLNNVKPVTEFDYIQTQFWKSVQLAFMRFESSSQFHNYISFFGTSLEHLEVARILFEKDMATCKEELLLPNLKSLKLIQVPTAAFQPFARCPQLKQLRFDIPAIKGQRIDILKFFQSNEGISLEELEIHRNSLYALPAMYISSIENIITSMGATLTKLNLHDCGNYETIGKIWNLLTRLEYFHIGTFMNLPTVALKPLNAKPSLKSLRLDAADDLPIDWLKWILGASPCLVTLFITRLRKEIILYVARNLEHLRLLEHHCCIIFIAAHDDFDENAEYHSNPGDSADELISIDGFTGGLKIYNDILLECTFGADYYQHIVEHDPTLYNRTISVIRKV